MIRPAAHPLLTVYSIRLPAMSLKHVSLIVLRLFNDAHESVRAINSVTIFARGGGSAIRISLF